MGGKGGEGDAAPYMKSLHKIHIRFRAVDDPWRRTAD